MIINPQMPLFADSRAGALFSDCKTWRYRLWRRWSDTPAALFIMLNPSTADETTNDPTVARCQKWARQWGYGAVEVCNLFAFRATDPEDMRGAADPVGPDNDQHILAAAKAAGRVICAWGVHGGHLNRETAVVELLRGYDLYALGFTQAGQPRHPLYLPGHVQPTPWTAPALGTRPDVDA